MVFALLGGDIDYAAADRALQATALSAVGARAYRDSLPGTMAADVLGQAMTDRMFRVPTEGLCEARSDVDGGTYI
jgi:hypothetical protein